MNDTTGSPQHEVTDTLTPIELLLRDASAASLLSAEDEQRLGRRIRAGREAAEALRRADLPPEERARLEAAVADGEDARRRFVEANQRLVISVARRYRAHGLDLEDLVQEGNLGLLHAIDRYDPERGLRFSTYAIWWIRQAIRRAIEQRGRPIRLPRHAADEAARIWRLADQLAAEVGGSPDVVEAAEATGLAQGRALELARATLHPLSLDATVDEAGETALGDILSGHLEDPEEELERAAVADLVRQALAQVPERARRVLELRFGLHDDQPRSLAEIGEMLGISRERARQLEADGLRRLRRAFQPLRPLLMDE
ncbi:MAG: sigma-70 family RNA polymerase sigma factor [Chloroflexota bacterium]|nr:sigma-70 family RNA polymerase sigma factor [Chloroflexota bacterium]